MYVLNFMCLFIYVFSKIKQKKIKRFVLGTVLLIISLKPLKLFLTNNPIYSHKNSLIFKMLNYKTKTLFFQGFKRFFICSSDLVRQNNDWN